MRSCVALFIMLCTLLAPAAHARQDAVTYVTQWVEVRTQPVMQPVGGAARLSGGDAFAPGAIAAYGPFRVLDGKRAAIVAATDTGSPAHFAAMLRNHPQLEVLEMVEAPGTFDDRANLQVGRMIRAAGLTTSVPANGQVRSGAVELFLAGASRQIAPGARFAVHSWMDDAGNEAWQYPDDAPEHRKYLAYYQDMGFDAEAARAFYALTNMVPHAEALWLDAAEMRRWIGGGVGEDTGPAIAYANVLAGQY